MKQVFVYKTWNKYLFTKHETSTCLQNMKQVFVYKTWNKYLFTKHETSTCLQNMKQVLVYKTWNKYLFTKHETSTCLQNMKQVLVYKTWNKYLFTKHETSTCLQNMKQVLVYKTWNKYLFTRSENTTQLHEVVTDLLSKVSYSEDVADILLSMPLKTSSQISRVTQAVYVIQEKREQCVTSPLSEMTCVAEQRASMGSLLDRLVGEHFIIFMFWILSNFLLLIA